MKLLMLMWFLHYIADFPLQFAGHLTDLKQRRWWVAQCGPKFPQYRYDYLCAMLIHSFVWAVVTFAPLAFFTTGWQFAAVVLTNALIHGVIDHFKANRLSITLWTDQGLHLLQIQLTAYIVICKVC